LAINSYIEKLAKNSKKNYEDVKKEVYTALTLNDENNPHYKAI